MAIKNDLQKILDQIEALTGKKINLDLDTKGPQELAQLLDTYEEKLNSARKQSSLFNLSLQETRDISKAIVQEMTKQNKTLQAAKSAMNGLTSIATELLNEERDISSINQKRLGTLLQQAKIKKQALEDQASFIKGERESTTDALSRLKLEAQGLNLRTKSGKQRAGEIANEKTILRAALDQEGIYETIIQTAEKRLKLEQATTKTFGLTGAAISAASSMASKFGMSHVQDQLEDINNKLREDMRKEIEANDGKALSFGKRFQYAAKGAAQVGKALLVGMLDPLFIMGKIFDAFLDVNKAAVQYTRLSGINATNQAALNSRLATSVDYLETAAELTRQLGMSATSVFSNDDIAAMAEAKNLLGLSAEQAGALGIKSKLANTNIDAFQDNLLKGVSAGNQLNNSLVAPGVALQDVLDTSEDISMSLGNNPKALGKAAVAARAFGLDLAKVNDIASTLLQFEDSIGNELEAELMTGKNLNLEKAREYALTNDLEGLSRELAKNGATAAEFAKMNRLEQESLAKALGMSREQLAKSVLAQEASKNATLAQRAAVMGVTKEQMQSMDIQERMSKTLDKLAQAFAPILDALVPIAEALLTAIQPIAMVVGYISSGLGSVLSFLSPLITGFTVLYTLFQGMSLYSGLMASYEAFKTGQMVAQRGAAMGYNTLLLARQAILSGELAKAIGIAAAYAIANPFAAIAGLVVAAGVGALVHSQMKDGVIDPKKGPVVSGEFGSVQLHPNDQIVAGTDLMGSKKSQTISQAVNKTDNTQSEIKQMREENKTLLTALLNKTGDVYMDTNKVGKAQMLGNYKSS